MYTYAASLVRVIDGDTVTLELQLGFHVIIRETFRLYGVNTPERKGETRDAGDAAADYVRGRLEGQPLVVRTHKGDQKDKYGRYLAEIEVGGVLLNDELLRKGHAVEYFGGKRE